MSANSDLSRSQPEHQPYVPSLSVAAKGLAEQHYRRAQEQFKMRNATLAVQELRDAIKINPAHSEYHALLAKVHIAQGLFGMANISLRQALKLNPEEPLALECLKELRNQPEQQKPQEATSFAERIRGFLTMKL
ncbi:hypothetical protein IQ268_15280 [Oculatella sp. LEGE 06141]|uniref:hypothetical protein n=1 Tax=Oculatella sp. LEGE 06141 TaxID=1828648 RepID=UPI0018829E8F|nr:hypothetical protein [Oculatella sp. LEGE 06141]MBE9179933.1 hypothetical protein [Oculatella sp. LEGE 06141]